MRLQPKAGSVGLDSVQRKGKSPTEKVGKKKIIIPVLLYYHKLTAHWRSLIYTAHICLLIPDKSQWLITLGLWANELLTHLFVQLAKATATT